MTTIGNAQKVYFDESGYTGNNLLNPHQNMFSYASVATDDDEAKDFVEYLIRKYNVQNGELKGSGLVKYNKGRNAIDEIFRRFEGRIKVSISNKKYVLASKFFEYIFEPCISEINSLFYGINFHRFIATILYVEFTARGAGAEELFLEFEGLMRTQDETRLQSLISSSEDNENSPTLIQIREFAQSQLDSIREELLSLPGDGISKWILDITDTALFTLLANWGKEYDQLTAVCDNSQPLQDNQELFNVMIGRTDRHFSSLFGERHPITFNLSGPLQLVDSKQVHGVQLADVIAAACVYAAIGTQGNQADAWRRLLPEFAIYGSMLPDADHVDLDRYEVQRNAVVLLEMHSRATKGLSLYDGMSEYIQRISETLIYKPIPLEE